MTDIRIEKRDADYLWYTLKVKDNALDSNNDEQFIHPGQYYSLYEYNGLTIKAVFNIKDCNAPMDSNEFVDWDNYDELYVVSEA
jgi:hypothetical protein